MKYNQNDILAYLESYDQEGLHFFIDLEHPFFFTAGSRLTLYADENRWAIVFEKSGYSTGSSTAEIEFAYFGNCLVNTEGDDPNNKTTSNLDSIWLIDSEEMARVEYEFELVAKTENKIKVRDEYLPIEHDVEKYKAKGIALGTDENNETVIDFPSFIRYLNEEYPRLFRATDVELGKHLPTDLPKLMIIDKWYHESYFMGDGIKPSSYETYKMIAEVLVSRDISLWKPTLPPNNDWRNWPRAGYV